MQILTGQQVLYTTDSMMCVVDYCTTGNISRVRMWEVLTHTLCYDVVKSYYLKPENFKMLSKFTPVNFKNAQGRSDLVKF